MPMDLTQNYFELFGLPVQFGVDQKHLRQQYRELQTQFHPDKFASKSSSEKRLAEQFSGLINSAYQTLGSPLMTAEYLLELAGHPINNENLTIDDGSFLFKQMEWRESLSDLKVEDAVKTEKILATLTKEVAAQRQDLTQQFMTEFDQNHLSQCTQVIAKWHFVEKMQTEIERLEDAVFEANN